MHWVLLARRCVRVVRRAGARVGPRLPLPPGPSGPRRRRRRAPRRQAPPPPPPPPPALAGAEAEAPTVAGVEEEYVVEAEVEEAAEDEALGNETWCERAARMARQPRAQPALAARAPLNVTVSHALFLTAPGLVHGVAYQGLLFFVERSIG
ncbi:Protein of unknown function [Gryllus bimaculatus]|nr:Protein of unknown function [Gryllus bimaculatus]